MKKPDTMKQFKYYAGIALTAFFAACSSDEPVKNGPAEPSINPDGTAYMSVRILDANGGIPAPMTKADNEYSAGSSYETAATSGLFLFYDASGNFVTKVSQWTTDKKVETEGTDINIEHTTNGILVLNNLKDSNLPKYMVCVLNNTSFQPGNTLNETLAKLNSIYSDKTYSKEGDSSNGKKLFVMSTTSYYKGESNTGDGYDARHNDTYYFATEINSDDYKKSAEDAKKNTVTVYVERLAAKVTFGPTSDTNASGLNKDGDYYKISQTIAGSDNETEGTHTDLYVKILGWDINATVKEDQSYMLKNLKDDWKTSDVWSGWQKASDKRSFWAKSTLYAKSNDELTGGLDYVAYKEAKNILNSADYCAEHTNTAENILSNDKENVISKNVTSVVMTAQVFEKVGDEYKAADLILYNGIHFKKEAFCNYILTGINASNSSLNIWVKLDEKDSDGNDQYRQISGSGCFAFEKTVGGNNGQVKISAALDKETTYYYKTTTDGTDSYSEYPKLGDDSSMTADEQLNKYLEDLDIKYIYCYTGGNMYYNIPIKHLQTANAKEEGYYGVVRNHVYKVTFSKLSKLGHAIFNPDTEVIIPDDDSNDTYYLGADVNILSWKIVNQNVEL